MCMQAEVVATFGAAGGSLSVLGDGDGETVITLDAARGLVTVNATTQGNGDVRAGPLPGVGTGSGAVHTVHAYVDHAILEVIVDNRTALVVYAAPGSATGRVAGSGAKSLDVYTGTRPRAPTSSTSELWAANGGQREVSSEE